MSRENAGPRHAEGCLGAVRVSESPTGHGHCACERAAWLGELVPRGQARAEVLNQLATWGHEQRILARVEVETGGPRPDQTRGPAWARAGLRMAASLAEEVYIGVRMTALNLAKECSPYVPRPAVSEQPVSDAVAAGERL